MPDFPRLSATLLKRWRSSLSRARSWLGQGASLATGSAVGKILPTAGGCTGCGKCLAVCPFLKVYGTPKAISENARDLRQLGYIAYRCSLCGLCNEICPEGLDVPKIFLEMRRAAAHAGVVSWRPYLPMLFYERVGRSRLFSLEILPPGCDTIFFPGCALPGAYPEETLALYDRLRQLQPTLGIVLGCCGKPSHDLGRAQDFEPRLAAFVARLASRRISTLLTACPSCADLFRTLAPQLRVTTAYQFLAEALPCTGQRQELVVTVHDACVLRRDHHTHQAVRSLLAGLGYRVEEMDHCRQQTLCCGQGGMVAAVDPPLASAWRQQRLGESQGRMTVVYCAGCSASFATTMPTIHLAQILADPGQPSLPGKPASSPRTYLNRLRLKWRLSNKQRK